MIDDDQLLREVAATAYSRADGDLMYFLMQYRGRGLPSYDPLFNRVKEVLLSRYDSARVDSLLKHLSIPRRDTMVQNVKR